MIRFTPLRWMRWYFLPNGGVLGYTVRVGILWFSPLIFLGTRYLGLFPSACNSTVTGAAVNSLIFGLLAGLAGHPFLSWATQVQEKCGRRHSS